MNQENFKTRCGYVTIIGRPNVGKSTLLNQILKKKISITSRKPQTTRHCLLGIRTHDNAQAIYVDTPGIQRETKTQLNRYMNTVASKSLRDVDLILFLLEALVWREEDELVFSMLKSTSTPILCVINKVDKVKDKKKLLPYLEMLKEKMTETKNGEQLKEKYSSQTFNTIFLVSAKTGNGVDDLENAIRQYLPQGPYLFPEDLVTDRQDQFMVCEMIREQLMRHVGDEIPYALTVGLEQFKREDKLLRIYAVIYVERPGQKIILIGKGGEGLKKVGIKARESLERYFGIQVFLKLWVKVKPKWTNDSRYLKQFGYGE